MALRAGSVGLGREAGLGARRGWTRRRRPLPRPGAESPARGPSRPLHRPSPALPRRRRRRRGGGCGGGGGGREPAGLAGGPRAARGVPAAAATLDASRALPVDRPSCGGRRGRARGRGRGARRRRCGGGRPRPSSPSFPAGAALSPRPPRGRGFPRGASPRPAPSSRLRTGADQGNPTV